MAQLIHYFHYKSPYGYLAQEQTYGLRTDIHQSVEWLPDTVDIPCFLARQNRTTQVKIPRAWATSTNGDGFRDYRNGAGRRKLDEIQQPAEAKGAFGLLSHLVGDELFRGAEPIPRVGAPVGLEEQRAR